MHLIKSTRSVRITTFAEDWQYFSSLPAPKAFLAVATLTTFLLFVWLKRPYRFPPGPLFVPVFGSLHFVRQRRGLSREVLTLFCRLRDKYGGIFSIGWFSRRMVVLADYESMREALIKQGQDFAGRPSIHNISQAGHIPPYFGILNSPYTEEWKQQRHISQAIMRTLSQGQGRLEVGISEEMIHLRTLLSEHNGKPFNPSTNISDAVTNIFCVLLFGQRFDYKDRDFRELRRIMNLGFNSPFTDGAIEHVPLLRFLLPSWRKSQNEYKDAQNCLKRFLQGKIEAHQEQEPFDSQQKATFIDSYRNKTKTAKVENRLLHILHDFFEAGIETTAAAVTWGIYYLAKHPEVQKKAYKEIIRVVGKERMPLLSDRDKMPYMEAVVMETLRVSCTSPLSIQHVTRCNTEVKGFRIPRGTWVTVCLWSVLRDPARWPEPEFFDPERFLNDSGRVQKPEAFIPFGIGRRSCLGEQLTYQQLFLFMTSLIRDFHIRVSPLHLLPEAEGSFGPNHRPPAFDVCLVSRV